jgi:RNA polymerase sigma factor (sigma-70 family)
MSLADVDITPYEGLVFSTARRYESLVDHDLEDIQQLLRLKVAQALVAFDSSRTKLPKERFVFACVRNRVKDMLKAQSRLNEARDGGQLYIEDQAPGAVSERMAVAAEQVFVEVDDELHLPSTLTTLERAVISCWLLDEEMSQAAIARRLRVQRVQVREAQAAIRQKMADWAPAAELIPELQLAA